MFRILTLLSFIFSSYGLRHNNDAYKRELRRQYLDYKKIFNKNHENIPFGFEIFSENLQRIDSYNKENPNCKMFLTQYSTL